LEIWLKGLSRRRSVLINGQPGHEGRRVMREDTRLSSETGSG
jgi:hypothetical protein